MKRIKSKLMGEGGRERERDKERVRQTRRSREKRLQETPERLRD